MAISTPVRVVTQDSITTALLHECGIHDDVGVVYARRLRRLREDRAWTQEELAERAHVDRSTISRAERGLGIRLESLKRLASALGISPRTLQRPD